MQSSGQIFKICSHVNCLSESCSFKLQLILQPNFVLNFKNTIITIVRTRFVATHNSVGFARKKAQTILFIEHGFERLGLGHKNVGFSWCSYMVKSCSPQESFSWRQAGRLQFLAIFPSLCSGLLTFPFILACVPYPSSTCRIDFSKTDTCPISPYLEWLGVVIKTGEYGSVRCRVLNGGKGSFPQSLDFPAYPSLLTQIFQIFSKLFLYRFCPSFQ